MSRSLLINEICSRSIPDQRFNLPAAKHYSCGTLPPIPTYTADRSGDEIHLSFFTQPAESVSATGSSIGPTYTLRIPCSQTFIHDFTFGVWVDTTNQKLRDHFAVLRDGDDLLTPDYITSVSPTEKVVVEFATVRNSQEPFMRTSYDRKTTKYLRALQARSSEECRVSFLVVVASSDAILTNMELTAPEIEELCYRHRLADDIARTLASDGIKFEGLGDYSSLVREVKTLFESMNLDWTKVESKFPQITREMYESWMAEPDLDYVKQLLLTMMEESADKIVSETKMYEIPYCDLLKEKREEASKKIRDFAEEFDGGAERDETRHKSTIPFPAWVPKVREQSDSSLKIVRNLPGMTTASTTEGRVWSKVLDAVATDKVEVENEDPHKEYQEAMEFLVEDPDVKKKRRAKYRRVPLRLDPEEEIDLACKGFGGKAHKFHPRVKEARKRSKQTFKLTTNTSDIERFVQQDRDPFNMEASQELFPELKTAFRNIETAHAMHGINETQNDWTQRSKQFYGSPLGVWLTMVTAIAVELAASIRQNCKGKQVIIKKLRMFDVFLLIKPTNSTSHIFFTLAIPKNSVHCLLSESEVFKSFNEAGCWYYTDLHSFKIPKLTNLTRAMSCVHNLYWFFRDFNGVNFFQQLSDEDELGLLEAERMTKVAMLVFFEDKARTEEIITISRYTFMEGFVALPAAPNPEKMIKKLPTMCRTKLQVWLMNRTFVAILRIINNPFSVDSVDGKARWNNMFNMFTGSSVSSPKRLISLFYLGYLKNKEEGPDKNGNSKLYEKIIEEEDKHAGRREYLGLKDPPIGDVRPHEYSPSLLKVMVRTSMALLEKSYGQNVMKRIEEDIDSAVASISLDEIATLKASSSFGPELYKTAHEKPYRRRKVATALMPMVRDEKTHLHHILTECLEKVEEKGGIHACLFKKQQHGGIREIYVLGIEERIVQLTYETIMKQVCKYFKSETLMNPKQKHIIPSNHGYVASRVCGGMVFTTCSSDDQSRWNQTQHVTKFAAMAVHLLPKKYHAFIVRASSLFMRKRLMIDPALLSIMRSITSLKTGSAIFQRMHSAYHGNSKERWLKAGDSYITTETGMMQGILHYTSSLMHTMFLEFYRDFSLKRMAKECLEPGTKAHMDILQSSDDSSVLLSFPYHDRTYGLRCRYFSLVLFEFKKKLGRYIGIESSPKSTSGTPFVVEFNSEFFFHNNHYRPEIRWIAAADLVCEHETLASRQEEMSNNLTSVLEGGSSLSLTAFCQIGQAILHYVLLGMTTTSLFKTFCHNGRWCPDPALGFFLMDHPFAAGATGFKYNLWVACKKTRLAAKYSCLLELVKDAEDEVSKEDRPGRFASLDTTRTGTFTGAVGVQWGDRQRWRKEIENMGLPEDYLEVTDARPEILYERATTSEDIKIKVAEKMHSPGVTESLSSGNSVNRVIAASVYSLSQKVMTDTSEWLDTREDTPQKHSLLYYQTKTNELVRTSGSILSYEQTRLLFPLSEEYQRIYNNLKELTSISAHRIIDSRPIIQTRISIVETVKFLRCSPVDLVSDMWFGTHKVNMAKQALAEEWIQLQQVLPWLSLSAARTLADSPFKHHCQLRNFLARLNPKGRMIHIVGAPIKRSSGMSNLMTAIRDNFFPGFTLSDSFDAYSKDKSDRAALLKHYVYMCLTSPLKDSTIQENLKEVMKGCPVLGYHPAMKRSKLTSLALIQEWVIHQDDKKTIRDIESSGSGVVGGYLLRQRVKSSPQGPVYYGDGVWAGSVGGARIAIRLGMGQKTDVTNFHSIMLDRPMEAGELVRFLREWGRDHCVLNTEQGIMNRPVPMDGSTLLWMHKYRMTMDWAEDSIPIIVCEKTHHERSELPLFQRLTMTVRARTINLRASDGRSYMNVLSYTANDAEANMVVAKKIQQEIDFAEKFNEDLPMSFLKYEPSRSWVSMGKLNCQTVTSILTGLYDKDISDAQLRLERKKTQALLRELAGNSLRRAGVGVSDLSAVARLRDEDSPPPDTTAGVGDLSLDDIMGEVMLYDDELINGPPVISWETLAPTDAAAVEEYMEADPMNAEEFQLMAFGAGRIRQDYSARFYEHPLLDAEIDRMTRQFPVREIAVYLRTKKVRRCRQDEVERLNKLLALPKEEVIYINDDERVGPAVMAVEELG